MYFGDDQTDEDAFRVVNHYRGISVFVGSSPRLTAARWRLSHPDDVGETLASILQERWKSRRAR
jgi:trehalose-phosphatase